MQGKVSTTLFASADVDVAERLFIRKQSSPTRLLQASKASKGGRPAPVLLGREPTREVSDVHEISESRGYDARYGSSRLDSRNEQLLDGLDQAFAEHTLQEEPKEYRWIQTRRSRASLGKIQAFSHSVVQPEAFTRSGFLSKKWLSSAQVWRGAVFTSASVRRPSGISPTLLA